MEKLTPTELNTFDSRGILAPNAVGKIVATPHVPEDVALIPGLEERQGRVEQKTTGTVIGLRHMVFS